MPGKHVLAEYEINATAERRRNCVKISDDNDGKAPPLPSEREIDVAREPDGCTPPNTTDGSLFGQG